MVKCADCFRQSPLKQGVQIKAIPRLEWLFLYKRCFNLGVAQGQDGLN